jgi:predicted transcriptional regulator
MEFSPSMPNKLNKSRSLRSNSEESGVTAAPARAPFAGYWCFVASPEQTGLLMRQREQQALRRTLAQVSSATVGQILAQQRRRCAICGRRLGNKCHLDLIISLASGGSYAKSNLQIVHPTCNYRKHANETCDFTIIRPGYLARQSALAKTLGLGRGRKTANATPSAEPEPAPPTNGNGGGV